MLKHEGQVKSYRLGGEIGRDTEEETSNVQQSYYWCCEE